MKQIKDTLPKGTRIINEGPLRVVKKPNGCIGYAAMDWEGIYLLEKMVCIGTINSNRYKISTLLDGAPFMAVERKGHTIDKV